MTKARAEKRMLMNLIHASDSDDNAKKEIKLWFK
jgi:nucleoside diphosphate kinase